MVLQDGGRTLAGHVQLPGRASSKSGMGLGWAKAAPRLVNGAPWLVGRARLQAVWRARPLPPQARCEEARVIGHRQPQPSQKRRAPLCPHPSARSHDAPRQYLQAPKPSLVVLWIAPSLVKRSQQHVASDTRQISSLQKLTPVAVSPSRSLTAPFAYSRFRIPSPLLRHSSTSSCIFVYPGPRAVFVLIYDTRHCCCLSATL